MRTTVRLDDSLLRSAKATAAERGVSLNQFIEDAVRAALRSFRVPGARTPLPTFAGAGLQPGVDLDDTSALLDLMEAASPGSGAPRDRYPVQVNRVAETAATPANRPSRGRRK
jgi:hypothetical protein